MSAYGHFFAQVTHWYDWLTAVGAHDSALCAHKNDLFAHAKRFVLQWFQPFCLKFSIKCLKKTKEHKGDATPTLSLRFVSVAGKAGAPELAVAASPYSAGPLRTDKRLAMLMPKSEQFEPFILALWCAFW